MGIRKITGYQVDGTTEVFDTLEEAERAAEEITMVNRYRTLEQKFAHEHPMLLRLLKIGDREKVDELVAEMIEFLEIRIKMINRQKPPRAK